MADLSRSLSLVPLYWGRSPTPFPRDVRFPSGWWADRMGTGNEHFSVFVDGVELARLRVGRLVQPTGYMGVPDLGDALEIKHIEVAMDARYQGVGTGVIEELSRAHPGRRLVAFSQEAEGFWEDSLGWKRCVDGSGSGSPLFVQRA